MLPFDASCFDNFNVFITEAHRAHVSLRSTMCTSTRRLAMPSSRTYGATAGLGMCVLVAISWMQPSAAQVLAGPRLSLTVSGGG